MIPSEEKRSDATDKRKPNGKRSCSSSLPRFGPCLFVDAYTSEFLSATDKNDGLARSAVTKLTKDIGAAISNMTVNAPDWTTWHAAKAAREMLWPKAGAVPLQHLVRISTQ